MAYFRGHFHPDIAVAKMRKNEAPLLAIRAQKESRPDWRRVGRNFPMISQKSRTNHWAFPPGDHEGIATNPPPIRDALFQFSKRK